MPDIIVYKVRTDTGYYLGRTNVRSSEDPNKGAVFTTLSAARQTANASGAKIIKYNLVEVGVVD